MTTTNNNHHKSTNKSELKSINEEQLIIIETEGDLNSEDNEPTPEEDISKPIRKKKRRVWGVRTKATLLAMAIGTVPVFAVGGIASFLINEFMYKLVAVSQTNQVNELQNKIHLYMKDRFGDIQVMANLDMFSNPKWRETATREEKDQALTKIQESYGIYDSIAVLDTKGNVVAQTAGTPLQNLLNRTYIQAALKANGAIISQPAISATSGALSVYTASPIRDTATGQPIGFIRARIPVKELEKIMYNNNGQEQFYLINAQGQVFIGPEGEYVLDKLSSGAEVKPEKEDFLNIDVAEIFPQFEELRQKNQETVVADNLKMNSQRLIAYAPPIQVQGLPPLNWRTIVSADPDIAFNVQYQLLLFFLWGTLATALLVGFVAVIIRPLAKIFYGIIRGYFLLIFSFSDGQNI